MAFSIGRLSSFHIRNHHGLTALVASNGATKANTVLLPRFLPPCFYFLWVPESLVLVGIRPKFKALVHSSEDSEYTAII